MAVKDNLSGGSGGASTLHCTIGSSSFSDLYLPKELCKKFTILSKTATTVNIIASDSITSLVNNTILYNQYGTVGVENEINTNQPYVFFRVYGSNSQTMEFEFKA